MSDAFPSCLLTPEEQLAMIADDYRDSSPRRVVRSRLRPEVEEFIRRDSWDRAVPEHFVELYRMMHERIYAVPPEDLDQVGEKKAIARVARMIRADFGGDQAAFADFVRWTWKREARLETFRRRIGREDGRMTWGFAFSSRMLTDWKVSEARNGRG